MEGSGAAGEGELGVLLCEEEGQIGQLWFQLAGGEALVTAGSAEIGPEGGELRRRGKVDGAWWFARGRGSRGWDEYGRKV